LPTSVPALRTFFKNKPSSHSSPSRRPNQRRLRVCRRVSAISCALFSFPFSSAAMSACQLPSMNVDRSPANSTSFTMIRP
jgi:hypothetical protein